jgi:hypothetical protein
MLTLERALRIVNHAAYNNSGIPPKDIVDRAAARLLKMHPWRCTLCPPRHLGVRASISIDNGTWTTATRTLTKTGAFTSYTHAPGDMFSLTAGTAATLRDYEVQEKVSSDAIILTEDCGATNGSADLDGTLNANRAAILPSNFGYRLNAYAAASTLAHNSLRLVDHQLLADLRSSAIVQPVGLYSGSLYQSHNVSAAGGSPAWRLELWPYPAAADPDIFLVSYDVAWSAPSVDSAVLPIPSILEDLFISLLRAITRGYEEEEEGTVEDRVDRLRQSSTFYEATLADGLSQPDYGPIRGGAEEQAMGGGWGGPEASDYVEDPA